VQNSRSLALCHYWVAFGLFLPAVLLGAWQMLMRSPLPAPLDDPDAYYASVTLHGTVMAYVLTTFFAMGFGYAITATSLGRPIRGAVAAWIGFVICLVGTVMAAATVLAGNASVLYTFYPPLLASPWYYLGAFLLIGGSMIWVVLMVVNMTAWKRDNPGRPVPLAMFAITATALLWAWAASGVEIASSAGPTPSTAQASSSSNHSSPSWWRCRLCSPCFRFPPLWKLPGVIAAAAGFSGGSERCRGMSRWCWRSACH